MAENHVDKWQQNETRQNADEILGAGAVAKHVHRQAVQYHFEFIVFLDLEYSDFLLGRL